jgi:diguanylate cyclase (GGDEF)-like protein
MSVSRFLIRVVLPVAALLAGALALAVLVLFAALRGADEAAVAQETTLVATASRQRVEEVSKEQRSIAIWDDSVQNIQIAFDEAWTHVNFGAWMFDYFGHNLTYILRDDDRPIYASSEGKLLEPRQYGRVREDVAPLVEAVRARSDARLQAPAEAGADLPAFAAEAAVTIVDGHPSVAAVMTIVPEDESLRGGARPYLLVSVKYLDRAFLDALVHDYQLAGAHFESKPPATSEQTFVALRDATGTPLAFLVWQPKRPGAQILTDVSTGFTLALVAVLLLTSAVLANLWRTSNRLFASREEANLLAGRSALLASHDALTGLANRGVLLEIADAWLSAASPGRGVALHTVDLDDFKGINDRFGHGTGDAYLREIALRLTGFAPEGACVARLGGDEFAILVAGVASAEEAELLAARLVSALRVPVEVRGSELPASGSVGTACCFDPSLDGSELFRRADVALFEAKLQPGGGRRAYDAAMSERVRRERQLREDLATAIAADGIALAYQPIFDRGGAIVAVEALARWRRGDGATIAPSEFVPIAEASGTIGLLTDRVLDRAARDAAGWADIPVSVNVSPTDLVDAGFAARLSRVLASAGLPPSRLIVEVTESAFAASDDLAAALGALRERGITVAIDDFGAGFSNLSRLSHLPVDIVKLDASLIAAAALPGEVAGAVPPLPAGATPDLHSPVLLADAVAPALGSPPPGAGPHAGATGAAAGPAAPAVLAAVASLGRAIGLRVVGEGIERPAHREAALQAGCDLLQGFLLSPPLEADELTRRLAAAAAAGALRRPGESPASPAL